MICYLIFSVLIAAAAFTVRRRSLLRLTGAAFYAVQAAFAVRIVAGGLYGETSAVWFAFDAAGTLFYCLLCIVSAFAFFHSKASLHDCDLRQTRTYAGLLMLLTTAIAGAYFASNLAVTWIFLEATTLCSAGIVYHRRTAQALEAAWKYVFVCSTGIAMAYLGILLLAAATDCESLDYATVAAAAPGGSALYLKTAFLLILCGYSCKAELFPLYTVGVDANFAAPAPASALISTGLVNAGFLALLRVYKLLAATEVFPWVKSVLLLVGVLSLVVGALFLRRTNNYKRFRYYDPKTGNYISQDPIGLAGGNPTLYGYVFDPNTQIDPLGLDCSYVSKDFKNGASFLITKKDYLRFIAGKKKVGRVDGQFVIPKKDMDNLLKKSNGDIAQIEKALGIPEGNWQDKGGLVRVDIPNPEDYNLGIVI